MPFSLAIPRRAVTPRDRVGLLSGPGVLQFRGSFGKGNAMTDIAFDSNIREPGTGRLDTATLRELGTRALFPWLTDAAMDWLPLAGGGGGLPPLPPGFNPPPRPPFLRT